MHNTFEDDYKLSLSFFRWQTLQGDRITYSMLAIPITTLEICYSFREAFAKTTGRSWPGTMRLRLALVARLKYRKISVILPLVPARASAIVNLRSLQGTAIRVRDISITKAVAHVPKP